MDEARELIEFYDANGWDWSSALAFTLCRQLFGAEFQIAKRLDNEYVIRRKFKETKR